MTRVEYSGGEATLESVDGGIRVTIELDGARRPTLSFTLSFDDAMQLYVALDKFARQNAGLPRGVLSRENVTPDTPGGRLVARQAGPKAAEALRPRSKPKRPRGVPGEGGGP